MTPARKPFVIRVGSQKGGEGKTVIAINLSLALAALGNKVLLVDADLHTAGIIYSLGLDEGKVSFLDILQDGVEPNKAIRRYDAGNIDLITQNFAYGPFNPNPDLAQKMALQITKLDYDFIVVDSGSATLMEPVVGYYSDFINVVKPLPNNVESEAIMIKRYEKLGVIYKVVLNEFGRSTKTDINTDRVESILSRKIDIILPHDPTVVESLNKKTPAYLLDKNAPFSKAIEKLAQLYSNPSKNSK